MVVLVDACAAICDAALWRDSGSLDEHRPWTAQHEPAVVDEVPILHVTIHGLVLAHGGYDNAIAQFAATQLQRCKQDRSHTGRALNVTLPRRGVRQCQ